MATYGCKDSIKNSSNQSQKSKQCSRHWKKIEYNNLIIQIEDLIKAVTLVASHYFSRRSNRVIAQAKEKSCICTKVENITNLALEAKEIWTTKPTHDYPDNIPSNVRSSYDVFISLLITKVEKLTSEMEYLHQRVNKLDKLNKTLRSNTVSTSTIRSGISCTRTGRKSRTSILTKRSIDKRESFVEKVKRKTRERSPFSSSRDHYAQEWETSRRERYQWDNRIQHYKQEIPWIMNSQETTPPSMKFSPRMIWI